VSTKERKRKKWQGGWELVDAIDVRIQACFEADSCCFCNYIESLLNKQSNNERCWLVVFTCFSLFCLSFVFNSLT